MARALTSYAGVVQSGREKSLGTSFPPFEFPNILRKLPEIPPEWRSMDPFLLGVLPTPPLSLPGPEEAVQGKENSKNNAERYMFRFGLENKRGECFRNASLTCLLHTPIFYNFLIGHAEDHAYSNYRSDPSECLTCMFQDVAEHYYPAVSENRAILYGKLDDFFQQSRKEFWGPHSNLKKTNPEIQVGPDGDAGGNVVQYTTWLIHYLAKQTHKIPRNGIDEHQLLKRMFWTSIIAHKSCSSRHRKFLWRKNRNWLQMNTSRPAPASLTIEDGLKNWFDDLATAITRTCETPGCKSSTACITTVRIGVAPEILLICAPTRFKTPSDSDFFFRIPFSRTIDLSAYSATGEPLKYDLQCMSLRLGFGFRTKGHVVSIVQAADGKVYKIDNSDVQRVVSPGPFVDRAQSEVFEMDQRLLPCFFVYVRQRQVVGSVIPAVPGGFSGKRCASVGDEVVLRRKRIRIKL